MYVYNCKSFVYLYTFMGIDITYNIYIDPLPRATVGADVLKFYSWISLEAVPMCTYDLIHYFFYYAVFITFYPSSYFSWRRCLMQKEK